MTNISVKSNMPLLLHLFSLWNLSSNIVQLVCLAKHITADAEGMFLYGFCINYKIYFGY